MPCKHKSGSAWNPPHLPGFCLFTCEHTGAESWYRMPLIISHGMDMHYPVANVSTERPFNNLLRKMRAADYALLAPHIESCTLPSTELLYNPGDDVAVVHFPCGPSLASYLIANEDGRDVETILIGREGAVGGIVSHGYCFLYTYPSPRDKRQCRKAA